MTMRKMMTRECIHIGAASVNKLDLLLDSKQFALAFSAANGEFVALNCTACHGEQGVSSSTLIPTLAGMNSAVIYKQLDDYRSGKRLWGVMSAISTALIEQDSADVAAYFAHRPNGLTSPMGGEGAPKGSR